MRLRTLLLGSAAAVLAVGTATAPAKAADPVGLAVAAAGTTMASYIAACANGEGWQVSDWCFALSGEAAFEASFGWDLDYGTTPGGNAYTLEGPLLPMDPNFELCLTATRETSTGTEIEVRFPSLLDSCGSGWPRIRITGPGGGRITLEDDEVEFLFPAAFGDVTFALNDDPTATLTLEFGAGNVDVELEAAVTLFEPWGLGAFGLAPSFSAELGFGAGNMDLTLFGKVFYDDFSVGGAWGYEVDATVEAAMGPAEIEVGAHVATVDLGAPVLAWGVHANAEVSFGMTTVSGGVLYGVNDDFGDPGDLRGNPYDWFVGDRILLAFAGLGFEWNEQHTTEFLVTYTNVLNVVGWDTLEYGVEHTFTPYGADTLDITFELWHKTDLGGGLAGGATGGTIGVTVPIF